MPLNPSQPVRFYGGMRVRPPRTKTEAVVFAVMANPEILRINGKNAQDPKVLIVHNCYTEHIYEEQFPAWLYFCYRSVPA